MRSARKVRLSSADTDSMKRNEFLRLSLRAQWEGHGSQRYEDVSRTGTVTKFDG
jgi:hypothetical protein